jgi:hypothetical protein
MAFTCFPCFLEVQTKAWLTSLLRMALTSSAGSKSLFHVASIFGGLYKASTVFRGFADPS